MKYLHTMVRVTDLDASLDFYCKKLGMREIRRTENAAGKYTLVFLAAPDDEAAARKPDADGHTAPCLELTYNWDTHRYETGTGFGHLAIGVADIYQACDDLRARGVKVVRAPGPMQHGSTVIAFVEDPNGYRIELIQRRAE